MSYKLDKNYLKKAQKQSENALYLVQYFVDIVTKNYINVNKIFNYLELDKSSNIIITNMVLYTLCNELIEDISTLTAKNFGNNLNVLKKWLDKQIVIKLEDLSELEYKIVLYLANGYTLDDLYNKKIINNDFVKKEEINSLVLKCNVENISQAMAVLYNNNSELRDIEKSYLLFKDII